MATQHRSQSTGYPSLTRRTFLKLLGAAGGSGAVWSAMNAWGLAQISDREQPPPLEGNGGGTRVIVLGAGPAGCTVAYELLNKGYDVQVLEARDRIGGHVLTVRQGTQITEFGGEQQTCEFDEGHYYDAGAWRIPYSHRATLYYCKHFNIPLQPHKNFNENAYVYMEGTGGPLSDQKLRVRELETDMGGYISELLAKAVDQNQLDQELSEEDSQNLIDYLVGVGLLSNQDLTYTGSYHRGYTTMPGGGMQPGEVSDPIPFADLLPYAAESLRTQSYYLASTASFYQHETMLQPVGGMSRIYEEGFQPALGNRLQFNAAVNEIRQGQNQVRIVYTDTASGETQEVTGDYCVCTIPLSVLIDIPADFSDEMSSAMREVPYVAVGKIGLQMGRRFWEEDDWIYGGLSLTNIPQIGTISYPDYNYQSQKGVIQGYYNFGTDAMSVSRLSLQERIDLALEQGSKIHPQYRDAFENGFSVAWHRVPYSKGGWATFTDRVRNQHYPRLLEPDGRIYLAGGHTSYVTSWQEGPISAAWVQLEKLHQRAMQEQGSG